jgi:hypothetical protein
MADSPKEAEAAQALFCGIADYLGLQKTREEFNFKKNPNYITFKRNHEKLIETTFRDETKIKLPSVSLDKIEELLNSDNDWYKSSINIAKTLLEEISDISSKFSRIRGVGWEDIYYVRGAKADKTRSANAMENISFLFDVANKNSSNYFGDINKWSPADIYLVSKHGDEVIDDELIYATDSDFKNSYTFLELNEMISELIESGDLLPLSLKKAANSAHIVRYNFDRSKEEEYFAQLEYYGVSDWSELYTRKKPITRDIKIYFSKDKKEKLKIRHDPYSANYGVNNAVKCEIEVSGAGGRGGSVVGIPLISQIFGRVDKKFENNLKLAFTKGIKEYGDELKKLNKKFGVPGSSLNREAKDAYDAERSTLSGLYVSNAIMPVIYKWFKDNERNKNDKVLNVRVIQKLLEYTSSRTEKSSKFVIAK